MLKIKSLIYRYFGIYLAEKEEIAYMRSKEGLREINEMALCLENQEIAQDIVLGTWQADNGFTRPLSFLRLNNPEWFWVPIANIAESISAIKIDLRKLSWKIGIKW